MPVNRISILYIYNEETKEKSKKCIFFVVIVVGAVLLYQPAFLTVTLRKSRKYKVNIA